MRPRGSSLSFRRAAVAPSDPIRNDVGHRACEDLESRGRSAPQLAPTSRRWETCTGWGSGPAAPAPLGALLGTPSRASATGCGQRGPLRYARSAPRSPGFCPRSAAAVSVDRAKIDRITGGGERGDWLLSVAQPKGLGRARASVSEPLRAYAIGKIATGKLRAGPAHGIPVAILPGPEACGLETAGLLLISSCLINRLALEACASLATRNACSGVLNRLRPNPGRRQASVTPAPRLRSWLAS